MAYTLSNKDVRTIKLSFFEDTKRHTNIIFLKQYDTNSNYIRIQIESEYVADTTSYQVILETISPSGKKISLNTVNAENEIYVEIPNAITCEIGTYPCELCFKANDIVLQTETFYLIVNQSNYAEIAVLGENQTSFLSYINQTEGDIDAFYAMMKKIVPSSINVIEYANKITRLYFTETETPSASEIHNFVVENGCSAPFIGVEVVVQGTYKLWHYHVSNSSWVDDGYDTISIQIENKINDKSLHIETMQEELQDNLISDESNIYFNRTIEETLIEIGRILNNIDIVPDVVFRDESLFVYNAKASQNSDVLLLE